MISSKTFRLLFNNTVHVIVCIFIILLWGYSSKHNIDLYFYNIFIQYTAKSNWNEELNIINITDQDLQEYGRWPWDRSLLAEFIDKVNEQQPSVIALDILFSESSPQDEQLISALNRSGRVIGSTALSRDTGDMILPIPSIANSYKEVAHTSVFVNEMGIPFSVPTVLYSKGQPYYSLGMTAVTNHKLYQFSLPEDLVKANVILNWYRGEPNSIYTFSEVMGGNIDSNTFTNQIVLISVNATGFDKVVTPLNRNTYGGYIHATYINNLLNNDGVIVYSIPFYFQIIGMFLIISFITLFNIKTKFYIALILYGLIAILLIGITFNLLYFFNIWISLIPALFALIGQFISSSLIIRFNVKDRISRLMKVAYIDKLTGIPNRRRFDEELIERWDKAILHDISLAIILIDIDNFKKYNDTYGHQQGDICLTSVAQTINKETRQYDLCARYGGEEFVILCSTSNLDIMCKRLNKAVEDLQIPHEKNVKGVVTISLGATLCYPHRHIYSQKEIIELADKGLYESKDKGRNTYSIIYPDNFNNSFTE